MSHFRKITIALVLLAAAYAGLRAAAPWVLGVGGSSEYVSTSPTQPDKAARPIETPNPDDSPIPDAARYIIDAALEADSEVIQTGPTPGILYPVAIPTETPSSPLPAASQTPAALLEDSAVDEDSNVQITIHRDPPPADNHLLGGVTRTSSRAGDLPSSQAEAPSPDVTPEEDPNSKRVGGQARGFTLIALMHPKARPMVEAAVEVLLRSNIQEVYLSALVDGSFGEDFNFLDEVVRRLNQGGRQVMLQLYLTNGPTQRKFETTPITAAFCKIDPYFFRDLIQYETKTRSLFKGIAAKARSAFELNASLGARNTNIAVMMLEDNLEKYSYQAIRELASEVLGTTASYVRNPCPGCYPGNDTLTFGDGFEAHDPALLTLLRPSDGYSLDGFGYLYPGEPGTALPYDHVKLMMQSSLDRRLRYFGLWRAGKQGLGSAGQIHPDERQYEVPNEEQKLSEIELLRSGLLPVDSEAAPN